ncbi:hypothetical protein QQ045_002606 [Rhodiola kirilowii]
MAATGQPPDLGGSKGKEVAAPNPTPSAGHAGARSYAAVAADLKIVGARSFADVAAVTKVVTPIRFPTILLNPRQYGLKDGKPSISFTPTELQAGVDMLKYALVAKFSTGRSPIEEVRKAFMASWGLGGTCSIGALDARHILIVLDNEQEARKVLSHPSRKLGHSFYRIFRWTKDFNTKKESSITSAWIRLMNLPPAMLNQGYIETIVSSLCRFIAVDARTITYNNPSYARVCIEIDITKSLPDEVWISTGGENGFWQKIEYENRLLFCTRCNLHGHSLANCRKAMQRRLEEQRIWAGRDEHGLPIFNPSEETIATAGDKEQPTEMPRGHSLHPAEDKNTAWTLVQKKKGSTRSQRKSTMKNKSKKVGHNRRGSQIAHGNSVPNNIDSVDTLSNHKNIEPDQTEGIVDSPSTGANPSLLNGEGSSQDIQCVPDSQPTQRTPEKLAATGISVGVVNGETVEFSNALRSILKKASQDDNPGRELEAMQGVGNKSTTNHLKAQCVLYKTNIVAILEPKIKHDLLPGLCKELGFDHYMHGEDINDHIWICWSDSLELDNTIWSSQQVTSLVRFKDSDTQAMFTFVYADCDDTVRQRLWADLIDTSSRMNIPWLVAGDFNVVSTWEEKSGGNRSDDSPLQEFNDFQLLAGLSDGGYKGNPYTWSNNQVGDKRIWERLDRVLLNGHALSKFPFLQVTHLARVHSDHCPLLVELDTTQKNLAFFHYQKAWQSHPGLIDVVRAGWVGKLHNDPLINVGKKLKKMRSLLRKWNWEIFGDTRTKMKDLLNRINSLEAQLQMGWNGPLAQEIQECKNDLKIVSDSHHDILKAKARMEWLHHGDHNSSLFHAAIKARRSKNRVNLHLEDDSYTNDRDVIGTSAVAFYKDLFGGHVPPPPGQIFTILNPMLSESDNEALCKSPNLTEVHATILSMNLDSSPGPDGFTGHFYSHCWEVIKNDLMEAVAGFFGGLQLPTSFSSTHLTLLPKIPNASAIAHLRPISPCNFCHKIISRILASRLAGWLPKIISEEQVGFVQGRSIHENIALSHDIAHDLNRKTFGGNIIIKLDMAKACDRISWGFILATFRSLGFNERWCDMIYRCIANCFYSVKWDGRLYGFFRSARGVRQGDPLSPSLFVVAMEWFSRVLKAGDRFGIFKAYTTKRPSIRINHLLFADDLLIFTNGAKNSVRKLLDVIDNFCTFSGQQLNSSKSILVFPKDFPTDRKSDLLDLSKSSLGLEVGPRTCLAWAAALPCATLSSHP